MTWIVPLPVLIPLLSAGLVLALSHLPRLQQVISVAALTASLVSAVTMLFAVGQGPLVLDIGGWAAPVGITLVADRLSVLMLVVSVAVTLGVLIYAIGQGLADGAKRAPVAIFHPTFLLLSAGVSNAFLTGDLFNLYVGFEILLVASFVLISLGGTRSRIRSGTVYIVVSLLGSVLFLTALALVYAATGTVNMAQLAQRLPEIDPGVALLLQVLLLTAFGLKAAVFPLSAWLPDSYPIAPAPVTAVFAGLLTKVGVYAIIRTQVLLFPSGQLDTVLIVLGMATMLVGILGAVAQDDLKRLLSYTLVSHIGFMIWGVAVASRASLAAAIFYVAHHITVQTALFLIAGIMERKGGYTDLRELGSLAKKAPLLAILFLVPALNLAGIPPFSGFVGKLGLLSASATRASGWDYAMIAVALLSSLLTLLAMLRVWNMAFWQEAPQDYRAPRTPRIMSAAATGIVAVSLLLTVVAGPLVGYATGTATALLQRSPYIQAVLPDGERGSGTSQNEGTKDELPQVEEDRLVKNTPAPPVTFGDPSPTPSVGGDK
ncbi:Na+/H+ antiporter subunit D [Buchananella hordeovulneris]|uniref:Na+/H+ antiporter subunit D n=1 Tax=Buchananella hordeovulneris TaxID=52770 RepID=UPI000F5E63B5|nr:Na+/H+ antiporter subunit D [Buchananella hordeovulneris]RRD44383.1 Na+/H+ antiporter subunit D [Buchananella hordeovulneris]RRD51641.1 Na+/H+ antiporter subunit D [Buchananella hordeovulneris]